MKGRIKVNKRVFNLVLGGLMVALGTVLSFIKVLDLPYGGSITLCSMLPVLVFSPSGAWEPGWYSACCSCCLGSRR